MNMLIAAILPVLLLSVLHLLRLLWWPQMWTWLRYVLGVLGLILPLTWLLIEWQSWQELLALWVMVVSGGIAVLLAFGIEEIVAARRRDQQTVEREKALLESVREQDEQRPRA